MDRDKYISLIYKELKGEISSDEKKRLRAFVESSSDNEEFYSDIKLSWELSDRSLKIEELDVEADLRSVKQRMPKQEAKVVEFKQRRIFLRIAAAAVFLIGAFWLFQNTNNSTGNTIDLFAANENLPFELPDGTKGILRQGSKLSFQEPFVTNRQSTLTGTAQFSVAHDAAHPFRVKVNEAEVKVLGTKFTIAQTDERIVVNVTEGRVSLSQNSEAVILNKGELGVCKSKADTPVKQANKGDNFLYWDKSQFRFEGEALQNIMQQLELIFDVELEIVEAEMKNCQLLGIFNGDDLPKILDAIAKKFKMEVISISPKSFKLNGGTCN